jgi:lipid A oxidase
MLTRTSNRLERTAAVLGPLALAAFILQPHAFGTTIGSPPVAMTTPAAPDASDESRISADAPQAAGGHDSIYAFFIGNPTYYRSTLNLKRPDGTDLELRGLGWDGDALHFPIDGGVRYMRWTGHTGFMLEHLHNKAIARLGRGAHGRKLRYPVVEEVPASGTWKGEPAPNRIRLADIFDRLEFTHGHNMLFLAGLMKFASPIAIVRPYIGLGGGVAFPHTEVWFKGDPDLRIPVRRPCSPGRRRPRT